METDLLILPARPPLLEKPSCPQPLSFLGSLPMDQTDPSLPKVQIRQARNFSKKLPLRNSASPLTLMSSSLLSE